MYEADEKLVFFTETCTFQKDVNAENGCFLNQGLKLNSYSRQSRFSRASLAKKKMHLLDCLCPVLNVFLALKIIAGLSLNHDAEKYSQGSGKILPTFTLLTEKKFSFLS